MSILWAAVALATALLLLVACAVWLLRAAPRAPVTESDMRIAEEKRSEQRAQAQRAPPEVARLERMASEFAARDDGAWDLLVAIGDVYRAGAYPRFRPDPDMALDCYRMAARSPDPEAAGMAQTRTMEVRGAGVAAEDVAGARLPRGPGERACAVARERLAATPPHAFRRPRAPPLAPPIPTEPAAPPIAERAPLARPPPAYIADEQNVHDNAVSAAVASGIRQLAADATDVDEGAALAEVRHLLVDTPELSTQQAADAIAVLDSLTDHTHSRFDVSERRALAYAWRHILQREDPEARGNLAATLAKQLASGVEHGHVVCSTGKIARIMGTFDGADDMPRARPTWAVRQEIAALAARVREEHLKDDATRRAYDSGHAPTEERIKEAFRRRAAETYCDELGMSPAVVGPMIAECEAAL